MLFRLRCGTPPAGLVVRRKNPGRQETTDKIFRAGVNTQTGQFDGVRLTPWRAAVVVLMLGAVLVACCAWWGGGGALGGGLRWVGVWRHASFRFLVFFSLGLTIALAGLAAFLTRAARRAYPFRRRRGSQDGTAILEFALVLPIALGIVLLMIQTSLLMGAFLCVNYASYCAARAAAVFVPAALGGEPSNEVADFSDPQVSEKIARVRQAAVWAVMPVSDGGYAGRSDYTEVLAEGLAALYAQAGRETPGWAGERLGRKLAYADANTSVELSPPADGVRYAEREDLRVMTKHNLYLSVPYASRVLAALRGEEAVDFGEGRYALRVEIPCTLRNEGLTDTIDTHPDAEETPPRW